MTCLKNIVNKIVIIVCLLSLSSQAFAWVTEGHAAIARWVYTDLSQEQQNYYLALATSLGFDPTRHKSDAQTFANLSTFADHYRKEKLKKIFKRFSARVPNALEDIEDRKTSRWHYHNAHVKRQENKACRFKNKGQLLPMMERLDEVLKGKISQKQEAILLGFQMHLLQDLHQPLHNFTHINKKCDSDLGGNRLCIKQGSGKCEMNLHLLWDIGFGVFRQPPDELEAMVSYTFAPTSWSQENLVHFDFVYDWQQSDYAEKARHIVRQQVAHARQRLRRYLIEHYEQKNNGK